MLETRSRFRLSGPAEPSQTCQHPPEENAEKTTRGCLIIVNFRVGQHHLVLRNRHTISFRNNRDVRMDFEKFSDRAKGFLQSAQTVALRMDHQRVTPAHLLKALLVGGARQRQRARPRPG